MVRASVEQRRSAAIERRAHLREDASDDSAARLRAGAAPLQLVERRARQQHREGREGSSRRRAKSESAARREALDQRVASSKVSAIRKSRYAAVTSRRGGEGSSGIARANVRLVRTRSRSSKTMDPLPRAMSSQRRSTRRSSAPEHPAVNLPAPVLSSRAQMYFVDLIHVSPTRLVDGPRRHASPTRRADRPTRPCRRRESTTRHCRDYHRRS